MESILKRFRKPGLAPVFLSLEINYGN